MQKFSNLRLQRKGISNMTVPNKLLLKLLSHCDLLLKKPNIIILQSTAAYYRLCYTLYTVYRDWVAVLGILNLQEHKPQQQTYSI